MGARTQCWNSTIGIAFVGLLGAMGLVGCEQKQPPMDATKEAPAGETKSEPTAEEAKPDMPAAKEAK